MGRKEFAVPPIFARENPRLILPCHARNAPDSRREAPDCPANGFGGSFQPMTPSLTAAVLFALSFIAQ